MSVADNAPLLVRPNIGRFSCLGVDHPLLLPVRDDQDTEGVSNYKHVTFLTSRAALISPDIRPCCATRPQRSCTPLYLQLFYVSLRDSGKSFLFCRPYAMNNTIHDA